MNREEYFIFHRACCDRMIETTRKKNHDYAGPGDDPFANFTRVEKLEICTTEQGFLTRMTDKLSRLVSFSQKGFLLVADESVEDTLIDLANYCILMAGFLRGKKMQSMPCAHVPSDAKIAMDSTEPGTITKFEPKPSRSAVLFKSAEISDRVRARNGRIGVVVGRKIDKPGMFYVAWGDNLTLLHWEETGAAPGFEEFLIVALTKG